MQLCGFCAACNSRNCFADPLVLLIGVVVRLVLLPCPPVVSTTAAGLSTHHSVCEMQLVDTICTNAGVNGGQPVAGRAGFASSTSERQAWPAVGAEAGHYNTLPCGLLNVALGGGIYGAVHGLAMLGSVVCW